MLNSFLFWIYWFLENELLDACFSKCGPQSCSINITSKLARSAELLPYLRPTVSESSLLQESQVICVHITVWDALNFWYLSESFPVQNLSFSFSLESHYGSCRITLVLPRTVAPRCTEFYKIAGEIISIQLRFFMSLCKLKIFIILILQSHKKPNIDIINILCYIGLQGFVLGITEKFSVVYLLCCCFLSHWHISGKITSSTFYDGRVNQMQKRRTNFPWRARIPSRRGSKNIGRDKSRDAFTFHCRWFLHKSIWLSFQWALWLPGFCLFDWLLLLCFTLLKCLQPKKTLCNSGYWYTSVKIFWKQFVTNNTVSALPTVLVFHLVLSFTLWLYE